MVVNRTRNETIVFAWSCALSAVTECWARENQQLAAWSKIIKQGSVSVASFRHARFPVTECYGIGLSHSCGDWGVVGTACT